MGIPRSVTFSCGALRSNGLILPILFFFLLCAALPRLRALRVSVYAALPRLCADVTPSAVSAELREAQRSFF
jgi:hypothetical protein